MDSPGGHRCLYGFVVDTDISWASGLINDYRSRFHMQYHQLWRGNMRRFSHWEYIEYIICELYGAWRQHLMWQYPAYNKSKLYINIIEQILYMIQNEKLIVNCYMVYPHETRWSSLKLFFKEIILMIVILIVCLVSRKIIIRKSFYHDKDEGKLKKKKNILINS